MKRSTILTLFAFVLLLSAVACAPDHDDMNDNGMNAANDMATEEVEEPMETTDMATSEATAVLKTADGTEVGTVTFTANAAGGVHVSADLHDVDDDGMHGFHIHEGTECSAPTFESAGGHFNPGGTDHACPPTTPRHGGDFGNVEITGGSGTFDADSDLISLAAGMDSIVGHAVILHEGEDDCTSQPSGAAGAREACGVIEAGDSMGMDHDSMDDGSMDDDAMNDDSMNDEGGAAH